MEELNDWDGNDWVKEFTNKDLDPLIEKGRRFINLYGKFKKEGYQACFEISKIKEQFRLRLSMEKDGKC